MDSVKNATESSLKAAGLSKQHHWCRLMDLTCVAPQEILYPRMAPLRQVPRRLLQPLLLLPRQRRLALSRRQRRNEALPALPNSDTCMIFYVSRSLLASHPGSNFEAKFSDRDSNEPHPHATRGVPTAAQRQHLHCTRPLSSLRQMRQVRQLRQFSQQVHWWYSQAPEDSCPHTGRTSHTHWFFLQRLSFDCIGYCARHGKRRWPASALSRRRRRSPRIIE